MVAVVKKDRSCKIDFAVPGDSRIEEKEKSQKTVLLGTARILRKVVQISGYWLWLDFNSSISSIVLLCVSSIITIITTIIIITIIITIIIIIVIIIIIIIMVLVLIP